MLLKYPKTSLTKTLLSNPKFISSQAVSATKEKENQGDRFKSNFTCLSNLLNIFLTVIIQEVI